jgi:hypothetical protein
MCIFIPQEHVASDTSLAIHSVCVPSGLDTSQDPTASAEESDSGILQTHPAT